MDRQAGKLGCLKWELDGGLISRAQIKVHVVFYILLLITLTFNEIEQD